ncbi:hypothetical protein [Streptomyces sp. NBC_01190]|uniref:hypothetical protein n=1 Tax=Streptomyces sp. NBC_01190 TaxID=2903767 RepID=UPI003867F91F|nr:hypothetical protein OG519_31295 [Streptomyces sp. NBC_01190]
MSTAPDRPASAGRIRPLPRTVDAISGALDPAKRLDFLRALGQAPQGPALDEVLGTWWMEAMFDSVPGRAERLAATVAGRDLVRLPDDLGGE